MGIEKLTTLAFSMYTNKGAYALLLGSGISRSAGIPSGWEVEVELIKMIAAHQGITNQNNWHQWYRERYKESASYSSLLDALVRTPTERVQLMRPFFEPTEEEKELGRKEPTKAHRAIARLVKEGYIRVILTTNFDHLLERALEAEGITPQVIRHEGEIAQATPLVHSDRPTLVKINGDYIDCKFRNTSEELDIYPDEMKYYLQRIFEDYGLVTCGWSADWDKGLIDIIKSSPHPRYRSFLTSVGDPGDNLKELSKMRHGEIMPIKGADELFSELCEQIMALKAYAISANMNQEMRIARLKKYLSGEQYRIEFTDAIEKWGAEAYEQITAVANYNFVLTPADFARYVDIHYSAVEPLLEAAILTARWGKAWQIKLFGDVLVKLCTKKWRVGERSVGSTGYLHALAPMLLFNTLGVACVKWQRFKELDAVLRMKVPSENFLYISYRASLLSLLACTYWTKENWDTLTGSKYIYPFSIFILEHLRSLFKDCFSDTSEYENVFYIWEHLKSLIYAYDKREKPDQYSDFLSGNFLVSRMEYKRNSQMSGVQEPYIQFFEDADRLKIEWEPIKQGMFGGNYDTYKQVYNQAEEYYSKCQVS
ncbi:SIR2 family protein [uncultured Porphyromonas sp.]|jgi:hypothetical protein|uniref:SIR2 family protein n=1 Tax=uncultured Porphyromonas sp. TaxID=159274 RepID=UPI0025F66026|nr:SIR2 family protein [uncultured Porphyromonas sp.]